MFVWSCGRGRSAGRPAGRTSGRTSGRTVVGGARVVSGAEKKAFDRGGLVWPPRSNAEDGRSGEGLWGNATQLPRRLIGSSGSAEIRNQRLLLWHRQGALRWVLRSFGAGRATLILLGGPWITVPTAPECAQQKGKQPSQKRKQEELERKRAAKAAKAAKAGFCRCWSSGRGRDRVKAENSTR